MLERAHQAIRRDQVVISTSGVERLRAYAGESGNTSLSGRVFQSGGKHMAADCNAGQTKRRNGDEGYT